MQIKFKNKYLSFNKSNSILEEFKLFWTHQNVLDMVQKVKFNTENVLLGRGLIVLDVHKTKTIWTGPKQFWTTQIYFGPIEGQGITTKIKNFKKQLQFKA